MSTFKEYLAESKKVYNFKVKIAGDVDKRISEQIKTALSKFDCTSVSKPKRTPITETPLDFPDQKHTHVNIFDVSCNYPTTSEELGIVISEKTKISACCIKVRNEFQNAEGENNVNAFKRIGTQGEALLNKPLEDVNGQDLVGEKKMLSFLKELGKTSHKGTEYKGVNDQLLAKSSPTSQKGR